MKRNISVLIAVFVLLGICSTAWAGGGKEKQESRGNWESRNGSGSGSGSKWTGVYAGVIPSAGGLGIDVVAILSEDGTYKVSYRYIEKGDEVYKFAGNFSLDRKSKIITLDSKELPPYYKAGKHGLTQLDMEGKEIKGKLAKNYKLRKVRSWAG